MTHQRTDDMKAVKVKKVELKAALEASEAVGTPTKNGGAAKRRKIRREFRRDMFCTSFLRPVSALTMFFFVILSIENIKITNITDR